MLLGSPRQTAGGSGWFWQLGDQRGSGPCVDVRLRFRHSCGQSRSDGQVQESAGSQVREIKGREEEHDTPLSCYGALLRGERKRSRGPGMQCTDNVQITQFTDKRQGGWRGKFIKKCGRIKVTLTPTCECDLAAAAFFPE